MPADLLACARIGRRRLAAAGTFASTDPATGAHLGDLADSGAEATQAAIEAARRCFDRSLWAQSPRLRQDILLAWASGLEAAMEDAARWLTLTNGKPLFAAKGEIAAAVSEIRYYAGLARHNPGHAMEVAPGEISVMLREPAGVAGIIVPWNAPAVLLIRSLAPAIAAGCTSIVKPAPQTAAFTERCLAPLLDLPQLPEGAVSVLPESGHAVAQAMVESPDVDVISFTGSNEVGQAIMAAAAPTMKKLSLELGGKNCCVVLEDADVAAIAPKLAAAATIISGQQCTAARRVLVHESRFAETKSALAAALSGIRVGNGLEAGTEMGPLITVGARDRVRRRIEAVFDAADEVVLRHDVLEDAPAGSAFLTPSLVAHRDPKADFCQEEIFGPMLVIEPFADEAEAVAKANDTVYGLSASVWTNRGDAAWRIARALRDGTVWINDHNKLFAEAETGGYRRSGLGRLHGFDALLDFCELKHVYQNVGVVGA
ncbi:aldehyde dehydrogenase family protein [Jiella sonneratiae]|uniref:Aldehyde dehydrogenase family protein n=1 Tax=Jiella sonneratiae TaxID=2816856 RepID=A0ABS3J262_9HYPH|nr:aldehyde dehydrogenase family protein [Jiella sonneratiae]MBO0903747.1 aldehyde dehydrogenase family protein [Jiella sonneratiae]